jgi:hypothetical protein
MNLAASVCFARCMFGGSEFFTKARPFLFPRLVFGNRGKDRIGRRRFCVSSVRGHAASSAFAGGLAMKSASSNNLIASNIFSSATFDARQSAVVLSESSPASKASVIRC